MQARPKIHPGMSQPVENPSIVPRNMSATTTALETTHESRETQVEVEGDNPDKIDTDAHLESRTSAQQLRDAGVSDAVWEQLQRDREVEAAKEEAYQRLRRESRDARGEARDRILKKLMAEEEERQRMLALQEKLTAHGLCPAGFHWIPQAGGFRCAGGSHFVPHGELEDMFK